MKRLYLLRHAQALSSQGGSDIDRKLSPNGLNDARVLGQLMKNKSYQPDFIFCSPALRTKETLGCLLETLEDAQTDSPKVLYEGSRGDLFALIQHTNTKIENLLIVAHNPTIHELAATLVQDDEQTHVGRLMMGYAPGTLSVFECDVDDWQNLQPGANALIDLQEPLDYNAPSTPARWT